MILASNYLAMRPILIGRLMSGYPQNRAAGRPRARSLARKRQGISAALPKPLRYRM